MTTFKSIAYQILKEAGKPLHIKEITNQALECDLVTEGKTPEATINALPLFNKKRKTILKNRLVSSC
jgi:hypothetical protein